MRRISRRSGRGIRKMNKAINKGMCGRGGCTKMIPTSTRVSISGASAVPANADAVAVLIVEKTKAIEERALATAERKAAERLIAAGVARGKAREVAVELVEGNGKKSRHVMVVGIGRGEKLTAEIIRQAAGALAKAARRRRVKNVSIVVPELEK